MPAASTAGPFGAGSVLPAGRSSTHGLPTQPASPNPPGGELKLAPTPPMALLLVHQAPGRAIASIRRAELLHSLLQLRRQHLQQLLLAVLEREHVLDVELDVLVHDRRHEV